MCLGRKWPTTTHDHACKANHVDVPPGKISFHLTRPNHDLSALSITTGGHGGLPGLLLRVVHDDRLLVPVTVTVRPQNLAKSDAGKQRLREGPASYTNHAGHQSQV